MRKHLAALAVLSALAIPGAAHASAIITFGSTLPVPAINNFQTNLLNDYGLTQFASTGASIVLDADSNITFYFLGSESGYNDSFDAGGVSFTETTGFSDSFAAPTWVGGDFFSAGTLAGLLNFTSVGGNPATVGDGGFSIFLGPNAVSGSAVSSFVFGYDDQLTAPDDDNHDDLIFRAVLSPVPEPATWALMMLGFGAIGAVMRRKRADGRRALAVA